MAACVFLRPLLLLLTCRGSHEARPAVTPLAGPEDLHSWTQVSVSWPFKPPGGEPALWCNPAPGAGSITTVVRNVLWEDLGLVMDMWA